MKKIIAVIIVIVAVLAILFWKPSASPAPEMPATQEAAVADDTESIDEELQTIEVENLDTDFSDLNKDIESL